MGAEKKCMGPCFNCPTFCQPTEVGICEDSHSIRTEVSVISKEGVRVRIERDVVTSKRNCHTEQVEELCGNVNCKFVNPREECSQRNSSTLAILSERKCEVCEAEMASRVILEEKCGDQTTRDCATDPLRRPWRKLCSAPSSPPGNAVEISEEEEESKRGARGRVGRVSLQDLLSSSVTSPVDDLVVKELSKIYKGDLVGKSAVVIPNSSREVEEGRSREDQLLDEQLKVASEEEQLLEEELKLVRRLNEQASGSTKIDMNVKYEFTAPTTTPSSNANQIYFDQVLLSQLQGETSGSPVLLNLRTDSPQQHEFQLSGRGDSSPFRFTTTETPDADTPSAVDIDARDVVSNFVATKAVMATTTTTTATTTAQSSSTTTTKAKSRSTTTASPPRRRLSSTELLKLCFTQGIGCDFSQNEVYTNPTTEAATTTTTTRPSLSQDAKQRLKHKVMLCFFQGICSDDDERLSQGSRSTTTLAPTTTFSTTSKPAPSRRNEISARIRERARACFFQGIC